MGETIVKIRILDLTCKKSAEVEVLADTGATYTSVPESILQSLGIEPIDKAVLKLADGSVIQRNIGNAIVEVEGRIRATPVIFGKEMNSKILGLVTLEACGLTVDTVNRKLVPLPEIHQYNIFVDSTSQAS